MKRMWSKNELRKIIQETYGIDIDNLVDKNGNERFLEGNININEITGLTKSYGKWSLSGTHLMIVLAGTLADTSVIGSGVSLANIELPSFIKDKIIAVTTNIVDRKSFTFWGGTLQTPSINLEKTDEGVKIVMVASFTANADKSFRIAFDLLIDNE